MRHGKGGEKRLLYLNDQIREDLRRYYQKMPSGDEAPVFTVRTDNQYIGGKKIGALSQSTLVDMIRDHTHDFKNKYIMQSQSPTDKQHEI